MPSPQLATTDVLDPSSAQLHGLKQAFLRGTGMPAGAMSADLTPETMELLGKILAASLQGTIDLLALRSLVKQEVHADVTTVLVRNNNPLKFFPDSQTVLTQMLRKKMPGFMEPLEAIADAVADLHAHQAGMTAGSRACMLAALDGLAPALVTASLAPASLADRLLPHRRSRAQWEAYRQRHSAAVASVDAQLHGAAAQVNDIGMRAENEDHIGMARSGDLACFVVADGTGGHAGGATASKLVVDALLGAFGAAPACDSGALRAGVDAASARLAMARRASPALSEMSSTVAALVIDEAAAQTAWAHLGDTRVYLFRANRLLAVTADHSLARQLLDGGYASADDVRQHPQRHILLAAVGAENDTAASTSDGVVALQAGDALLLCSDGLWEWLADAQMEAALAATLTSDAWLMAMCDAAAAAAADSIKLRDNFSACAIRVHARGEPT